LLGGVLSACSASPDPISRPNFICLIPGSGSCLRARESLPETLTDLAGARDRRLAGLSVFPARSNATFMHAARSASADARFSIARAITMPPIHNAAVAGARTRASCPRRFMLRSRMLTLTANILSGGGKYMYSIHLFQHLVENVPFSKFYTGSGLT